MGTGEGCAAGWWQTAGYLGIRMLFLIETDRH